MVFTFQFPFVCYLGKICKYCVYNQHKLHVFDLVLSIFPLRIEELVLVMQFGGGVFIVVHSFGK